MRKRLAVILTVLRSPTPKHWEAYGRVSDTISVASLIGAITIIFTPANPVWQVVLLFIGAVVSFYGGAVAFGKAEPPKDVAAPTRSKDTEPLKGE